MLRIILKIKKKMGHHRKLKIKMIRRCRVGARGYIVLFIPWGGGYGFNSSIKRPAMTQERVSGGIPNTKNILSLTTG
jgi:hypothetical protein